MECKTSSPTHCHEQGCKETKEPNYCSNSLAQRNRILKRLREKPCTTVELRHEEDVLGVAPRVHELRHLHGFNIQTHWAYDINPGGNRHRVAKYILMPGKWQGGSK